MAIDFQKIEAHNVDIENFSYNVSDMVDSIYIGPQGELLEKVEEFNHRYNCNIGITKSFTLKPGGYDQIKKAYANWILRHDLKPRGIKSLFDRITQYHWREQHFKQEMLAIETRMKNLKISGMRWQDNTDQFEEELNKLKDSIINALNATRELYPGIEIHCKIIPVSEGRLISYRRRGWYGDRNVFPDTMFSTEVVDFVIMFYVKIKNMDMMVHVMSESDTMSEYRLPMGDVYIASGTYLLPLISRHWGRTTPITGNASTTTHTYFLEAIYLSEMNYSEHPYIAKSTDKYSWELKGANHGSNICTGNMNSDIRNSLLNNEIMAHIVQLITWVTNYYVPQTNPLNRINKMRRYGDDIKFVQWRGDLNDTSTQVFRPSMNSDTMPHDCNFGGHLYDSMYQYARNQDINYSSYNSGRVDTFNRDSIEFPLRFEEYLNKISLADMPCNNCSFKSECNQWDVLQLIFKDSLTFEEEACFGMLYEFHEFSLNILNRSDAQNYIEIYFAEMAIYEAWRWKLDWEYLKMVMCHKMIAWWTECNNETFLPESNAYRRRIRELFNKADTDIKHLFEYHYLNHESDIVWTIDSIRAYRAPAPDDRLDEPLIERYERRQREMADENQRLENDPVREWLESTDTDTDGLPFNSPPVSEDMTPEQRSIQWAIEHGGANNL